MKVFIPYIETKKQKTLVLVTLGFLIVFSVFISLTIYHSLKEPVKESQNNELSSRPGGPEIDFIHTTHPLISNLDKSIHFLRQINFENNFGLGNINSFNVEVENISNTINDLNKKYPSIDIPQQSIDDISLFVSQLSEKQNNLLKISQNKEKINSTLNLMVRSSSIPISQAPQFDIAVNNFLSFQDTSPESIHQIESILSQWRQSPPVQGVFVDNIISTWLESKTLVTQFGDHVSSLSLFNDDLNNLSKFSSSIVSIAKADLNESSVPPLSPSSPQVNDAYKTYMMLMFVVGFLFLLSIIYLFKNLISHHSSKFNNERQKHDQDQKAILQLLSEIEPISEGDLTISAKVTEHVTGAIADAINLTLEKLRGLVSTIQDTSSSVAQNCAISHDVTLRLNEATAKQTHAIDVASDKNQHISTKINEISSSTKKASEVAHQAVSTSSSGSMIVKETISGMDSIRDQMQITSKRIKKLGESAQEIGGIIEFIKAISEQTGLLALNSAIRAATAGREGNDFAVIADEVQHLSDRVTSYVSKIERIIQDIQQDTQKTIESMEQTTSEVVAGARLAEDAGQALDEIEKVSLELSNIIDGISSFSQQQSQSAVDIVKVMEDIKSLNSQTIKESQTVEEAVENLLLMSNNLIDSLSGFKISKNMPLSKNN